MTTAAPLPTTSVVICCFSDARFDDTCAAVRSVLAQIPRAPETVVVVDHNPRLRERLARALPGILFVENAGAPGLSGARNVGVAASCGELVVFLDDDARAAPDMICRMATAALDRDVLGVAGRVLPDWSARAPAWFPEEFLWVVGCTYAGMEAGPVRNPIGAAMAIRRSVFETVGGFSTDLGRTPRGLPLGCEETELAIRAASLIPGGRFLYVPDATCRHRVPAARATWSYLATRCWAEGLSKAALAQIAGNGRALASERTYVRRTLPRALSRALVAPLRGDAAGLARAAAILAGLTATVAGYAAGALRRSASPSPPVAIPGEVV